MGQKFCEQCGAARLDHHKFCTGCGEAFTPAPAQLDNHTETFEAGEGKPQTDHIAPDPLQIEHSAPGPEPEFDQADVSDFWEDVPQKPKSTLIISILIIALIAGVSSWLIWGRDKHSELLGVVVTGPANVRDHPSTSESKIVMKFDEGKELAGRWVAGIEDPDERWLEFEDSNRLLYVWEGNLRILKSEKASNSSTSESVETYRGKITFPDFGGRDRAFAAYRTRITDAMRNGPNFSGKYVIEQIGCGTECSLVYIADVSNGRVYDFPYGGEEHRMLSLSFRVDRNTVEAKWLNGLDKCMSDNLTWEGQKFSSQGAVEKGESTSCFRESRASGQESCRGRSCRTLTTKGWAGIESGMTVSRAKSASGLTIQNDGDYDIVDYDCRRYEVVGGPSEISMLVEDGIVTSITAWGKDFRTDRGVKIGDRESVVRSHYKSLEEEPDSYGAQGDKQLIYEERKDKSGVKFIVNSGFVSSITVGGSSLRYIEGCL